jgi:PAS domain S-box-containing protein
MARHQDESDLQAAELAGILASTMDAIIAIDEDQRVVLFNPSAERIFGLPVSQALGTDLERFIPERFRKKHRDSIREFGETGISARRMAALGELRGLRSNGGEFPFEASIALTQTKGGKLFTVILRDVSEQRRAEAAEAGRARILDESLNEIYVFREDDLRFIDANRGARENLGYTLEELRALTPLDVKPEFTREQFEDRIAPLRCGAVRQVRFETIQLRKDGTRYPVEVHIHPGPVEGAASFVAIVLDITERNVAAARERDCEHRELEDDNRRLCHTVDRTSSFGELVGKSGAMNEIYGLIRRIVSNRSNVLITGESGTGKEVVARTIHFTGTRSDKPFIPINCTAMPEGLLESELFGHVRGAFTGAHSSKKGLFEAAEGGTLFLDEIGDMPTSLQGKLLRVLQDREIRPVGGNNSVEIDVRIIAATNRDLEGAIRDGTFREDLFYRLNVLPIRIPPLRERPDDIPVLAQAFLRKHTDDDRHRLSESATRKLMEAPWLGNARELENCIERALVLADSQEIQADEILLSDEPERVRAGTLEALLEEALDCRIPVRGLTESYIDAAIERANGRMSWAARLLGMNRRTLYRREERLGRIASGESDDD